MTNSVETPVMKKDPTVKKPVKKIKTRPKISKKPKMKMQPLIDYTTKMAAVEFKNKFCTELD